ncbi:MAG: hypothetical protein LW721_17635 [Flammeovirgaceae bacterium]|jgi:hypothetical protein|nr:hypothetical protein [Flammeovirgaceae bacterium]
MRSVVFGWFLLCLFSCGKREAVNNLDVSVPPIVKAIIESIHDPIDSRGLQYNSQISENSYIVKSLFTEQGNLKQKEKYDQKGNMEWREVNSYDKSNNPIKQVLYHYRKVSRKTINRFNELNQLIENTIFDADGKLIEKKLAQFNSQQERTLTFYILKRGVLEKNSASVFNKSGNNTENLFFSDKKLVRQELNKYDNRGNRTESLEIDLNSGMKKLTHFNYNIRNDMTEMITLNASLMIESRITYAYDSGHHLIKHSSYGVAGNHQESKDFLYEFDAAGQWIKQITFEKRKAVSITVRSIEYY